MGMTENKLIKTENEAIECLKKNKPTSGYYMLQESVEMGIKALEKQIPKKPSEIDEKEDGLFYVLAFMCPTCNEPVIGQPYKPKHCKHCGQALDWGNEDAE